MYKSSLTRQGKDEAACSPFVLSSSLPHTEYLIGYTVLIQLVICVFRIHATSAL